MFNDYPVAGSRAVSLRLFEVEGPSHEGEEIVWYPSVMDGKFPARSEYERRELVKSCVFAERPFDGDTGSADTVYTDESLAENRRLMSTASYWINGDNTLTIDIETDTIMRTLHNLLGDPQ